MATLAQLGDRARRKMNLGLGEHTVTITYASVADGDTVTVHGIILTCITGSAAVELAQFKKETDAAATAANLEDLIDAIFDSTTGVSSSSSAAVVTITGARSVTTSNSSGFAISSSSYQDEPPYTSDIDQFLLDGQLDIANKCIDEALLAGSTGLSETFSLIGNGVSSNINVPSEFLRDRTVSAKIGNDSALYRLKKVSIDEMLVIREGKHDLYKVDSADGATKYYAIYDDQVYFSAPPVAGADMAFIYGIKRPQEVKATECDLPNHLEPLLVDYAVGKVYEQMQRYDMAGALLQFYMSSIMLINQQYSRRR